MLFHVLSFIIVLLCAGNLLFTTLPSGEPAPKARTSVIKGDVRSNAAERFAEDRGTIRFEGQWREADLFLTYLGLATSAWGSAA